MAHHIKKTHRERELGLIHDVRHLQIKSVLERLGFFHCEQCVWQIWRPVSKAVSFTNTLSCLI